jgi:hypothetical protein
VYAVHQFLVFPNTPHPVRQPLNGIVRILTKHFRLLPDTRAYLTGPYIQWRLLESWALPLTDERELLLRSLPGDLPIKFVVRCPNDVQEPVRALLAAGPFTVTGAGDCSHREGFHRIWFSVNALPAMGEGIHRVNLWPDAQPPR